MPKRITYLEARPDKDREAFRTHWSTTHAEIARDLPGVTAYRQNHVLPPAGQSSAPAAASAVEESAEGLAYRVDGIVELWFADEKVVGAGFASDVAARLIVDEPNFLSGLTGGPVTAGTPNAHWPFKVWVLARWADGAEPARDALECWAEQLSATHDGALGWGVNVLVPGAELLVREALRREEPIPEVAVSIGFATQAAAQAAADELDQQLAQGMDGLQGVLTRLHACLAEEIVIV
ncbi:MAG: EthD domain-containing protein [Cellulosimicrobium cellulans]